MLFDDIKAYLENRISADNDLKNKVKVKEQYLYGKEPHPPELLIDIVDMPEHSSANTFDGEQAADGMLQIIVMCGQMRFNNALYGAQKSCNILADKVCKWFNAIDLKANIPQLINTRRVQIGQSVPYEEGTVAYYSILRFELTVGKNI